MFRLPIRRRAALAADRATLALAATAAATAGTVIVGQFARMARRRAPVEPPANGGVIVTAEHALGAASQATQDTVTVAREAVSAAPRGEIVLFNILSGFTGAVALVRLSTWGIRGGWWPASNVRVGGRHVHHFVPGILAAFFCGGAAMVSRDERVEELLAFPFGAGIGLTFDEAALLLEFEDVYWSREGLLSVQVSLGMSAVLGATILALRMLRRGERGAEQAGLIPGRDRPVPGPVGGPGRQARDSSRAGPAFDRVAGEELARALLVQQPGEPDAAVALGEPGDEARADAPGHLRGVGDEHLVEHALLEQLAVESRAALAEQRAHAALGAQVGEQGPEVDSSPAGERREPSPPWAAASSRRRSQSAPARRR